MKDKIKELMNMKSLYKELIFKIIRITGLIAAFILLIKVLISLI